MAYPEGRRRNSFAKDFQAKFRLHANKSIIIDKEEVATYA